VELDGAKGGGGAVIAGFNRIITTLPKANLALSLVTRETPEGKPLFLDGIH
jgi:hypothetical protein